MKTMIISLAVAGCACVAQMPALAQTPDAAPDNAVVIGSVQPVEHGELDRRLNSLTAKFKLFQAQVGMPGLVLRNARVIFLLDASRPPDLLGYHGASGVVMARGMDGAWGPPAFVQADDAAIGAPTNARQNFFVLVSMRRDALDRLVKPAAASPVTGGVSPAGAGVYRESSGVYDHSQGVVNQNQGVVVSGTADAAAAPSAPAETGVLLYDNALGLHDNQGVFNGAIVADDPANGTYYGQSLTARNIVIDRKASPSNAGAGLMRAIRDYTLAVR